MSTFPFNISCFPSYHQQVEPVFLFDARQYSLGHPELCVLWPRLHELPGIGAAGKCRGLQYLNLLLGIFRRHLFPYLSSRACQLMVRRFKL